MFGRTLLSFAVGAIVVSTASAQVSIRAPFVRVETGGGGTYVRAPFVSLYFPPDPPVVYYGPPPGVSIPGPRPAPANPGVTLPQPRVIPKPPLPNVPVDPNATSPSPAPDLTPPAPAQAPKAPTIAEFAKAFKPKAGNYEITLTNPVSRQAEAVKFSLPGEPQQVRTSANSIEFVYGPRRFVRIEFDQDGPTIISR
jgi:hypothetical protein